MRYDATKPFKDESPLNWPWTTLNYHSHAAKMLCSALETYDKTQTSLKSSLWLNKKSLIFKFDWSPEVVVSPYLVKRFMIPGEPFLKPCKGVYRFDMIPNFMTAK